MASAARGAGGGGLDHDDGAVREHPVRPSPARCEVTALSSAAARPGRLAWLVLAYRLPASHGLKITVRRRLTAMGAVFPVNAVAAMPASPAAERALRRLRSMIGEAGGSAQVLRATVIEGAADLSAAFNAAREREYTAVIAGCGEVMAGIEAMTAAGRFRYPDLGDKDAELRRLSMRIETIRARDVLGAANAEDALSALATCRTALDTFAASVYRADTADSSLAGRAAPALDTRVTRYE
jgi:hypothetical protein